MRRRPHARRRFVNRIQQNGNRGLCTRGLALRDPGSISVGCLTGRGRWMSVSSLRDDGLRLKQLSWGWKEHDSARSEHVECRFTPAHPTNPTSRFETNPETDRQQEPGPKPQSRIVIVIAQHNAHCRAIMLSGHRCTAGRVEVARAGCALTRRATVCPAVR